MNELEAIHDKIISVSWEGDIGTYNELVLILVPNDGKFNISLNGIEIINTEVIADKKEAKIFCDDLVKTEDIKSKYGPYNRKVLEELFINKRS